jgi:hypothetical protein
MTYPIYIDYTNTIEEGYEVFTPIDGVYTSLGFLHPEHLDALIAGYISKGGVDIYIRFNGMQSFLQIWPNTSSME